VYLFSLLALLLSDQFGQLIHGINHMAVELGELERMRQEFISNVSHEIQSPLTSINGFAKALKNMDLQEDSVSII